LSAELHRVFRQLSDALDRLREALAEPATNSLAIDGTIQRFEFTIELFWKVLKRLLAHEGIEAFTPRETLQQAFQIGWLTDEAAWLELLRDRNQTSHAYDEALARAIYERVRDNFPELERVLAALRLRLPPQDSDTTT